MASASGLLKRYLPTSLFWRAFLILVIPILVLQGVVASVFIRRHYDAVTVQMAGSVAQELGFAIRLVEAAETETEARTQLRRLARPLDLGLALDPDGVVEPRVERAFYDLTGRVIAEIFQARIVEPISIDFVSLRKRVDVRIVTDKGVLRAQVPRGRVNASNPHLVLVWMTLTAMGLTAVAAVFLRNQMRPIRELALAAAAFGRGRTVVFRPRGAEEVRWAGHAFLDMRKRIERQIGQRTALLSGVSHDLRTPLTRMKLALAVAEPGPETAEIARDVEEMERMIEAFLDFARGEGAEEPVPVDVVLLAQELVDDAARKGHEVMLTEEIDTPEDRLVALRRDAIKRCLTNLIENATRYGTQVALRLRLTPRILEFTVEDDGPGIQANRREEALKPFARLDESRNQDAGSGVGLGLSIALDIARSHGGSLALDDSPGLGGLRATVLLPR
ncbi:MAG: ATP-binding protein [Pseudomonadota bacterium]